MTIKSEALLTESGMRYIAMRIYETCVSIEDIHTTMREFPDAVFIRMYRGDDICAIMSLPLRFFKASSDQT